MNVAGFTRQISAGVIVGLSAVIYSISYGALLFAGPLSAYVGFGITVTLITAVIGALFGWFSEGKAFIAGPDSNTVSVMASILAVLGAMNLPGPLTLQLAVATLFLTSLLGAAAFFFIARAKLSSLVRYIPFSVTAGFLAATGWLMSSGALNIISGTPLTIAGMQKLIAAPVRPELAFGLVVVAALFGLAKRVSGAVLIPLVMIVAAIAVNVFLRSGICDAPECAADVWLFSRMQTLDWLPPWRLSLETADLGFLIENLPAMLVVAFVGVLTILLSVASLELNFHTEFNLNKVLKTHAAAGVISAMVGGFLGIISIGRTMLNRQAGGGAVSGAIAAAICLATLFGAGVLVSYLPKAALGGLVLFLGLGMLKQWVWDQRRATTPLEFAQILLILALVAGFGFLVGFSAGLLISCVMFVVTYSRIPLADLATNLALFPSTVGRPEHEADVLRSHGEKILLYRLSGYVFFGSASKIEAVFQHLGETIEGVVVDFSNVSGIDSSAIGVFQRILRRYRDRQMQFYFVHSPGNEAGLRKISRDALAATRVQYFASLDHAIETAEEHLLGKWGAGGQHDSCFEFFPEPADRAVFAAHCEFRQVAKGDLLCGQGERSAEIFFVAKGSLEVIAAAGAGENIRLAKLHDGAIVGELAFYTGEARTAAIAAAADSSVYVFHKDALARLRASRPDLATIFDHMVIRKISRALTRTNKLVAMFR